MGISKVAFLISLAVLVIMGTAIHAVQLFEPYTGIYSGDSPQDIVCVDLDGNGNVDIVSVNYSDNSVTVHMGTGTGTFVTSLPITLTATQSPFFVEVADMDQDGNLDIVVPGTWGLDILYGDGDGTFGSVYQTSFSITVGESYIADFDGNTYPDVAASHTYGDSITVFMNNGDSTFTVNRINVTYSQKSIVGGKFNADAYDDLVVACLDGKIYALTNDQSGDFAVSLIHVSDTSGIIHMATGDINDDSLNDVAVLHYVTDSVTVLVNNGNGTYDASHKYFAGGTSPEGVCFADFNSDSNPDMVISAFWDMDAKFFSGDGTGAFTLDTSYALGGRPSFLYAADFDNDGYLDMAGPISTIDSIAILMNRLALILDVDDLTGDGPLPNQFSLEQNYPNPFNPSTIIRFSLPTTSNVRLEVFNLLGQSVKVLVDDRLTAGVKEVTWDGRDRNGTQVSTGIYFYRIASDKFVETRRMVFLK